MGDNLSEELYRAFCNAAGLSYGSDETPSYHNLPTDQRYAWEQAAAKARQTLERLLLTDVLADAKAALLKLDDLGRREDPTSADAAHSWAKARMFVKNIIDACERKLGR